MRTVALDRATVTMLRHLRTRHRSAIRGNPQQFIFLGARGKPISPGFVSHAFVRSVAEFGLPPIRFHDLRHGAASLSLAAVSEPKTVQALLGHDSIVLTADTYTSVLPCLGHAAAEATARLVMDAEHRMASLATYRTCNAAISASLAQPATSERDHSRPSLVTAVVGPTRTHTRSTANGMIDDLA